MSRDSALDVATERYFRRRAGLPSHADERRGWRRIVTPLNITTLVMTILFVVLQLLTWLPQRAKIRPDGFETGYGPRALWLSFNAAWPTLVVLAAVLLVVDRWRPQPWQMWWMALGWGASVATFVSLYLNTAASALLNDGAGGNKSAVFAAPFVEEAAKASVLFLLAIAYRYKIVNATNAVVLACMSAIGFAFTENILYYVRAYAFSRTEIKVGDPDEALRNIAFLRGVVTAWGHPSFTIYTGLGLAVALRARSKTVRILAPVAGFLLASALHMFFNFQASAGGDNTINMLKIVGISVCVSFLIFIVGRWLAEGVEIRHRLRDYVRMGWLPLDDVTIFGTVRGRTACLVKATLRGPKRLWYTVKLLRRYTELAYLRDLMTRGVVDAAGVYREREILGEIAELKPRAIAEPKAYRYLPRRKKKLTFAPPSYPGPAGLGGSWPALPPANAASQYSANDPSYAPPRR